VFLACVSTVFCRSWSLRDVSASPRLLRLLFSHSPTLSLVCSLSDCMSSSLSSSFSLPCLFSSSSPVLGFASSSLPPALQSSSLSSLRSLSFTRCCCALCAAVARALLWRAVLVLKRLGRRLVARYASSTQCNVSVLLTSPSECPSCRCLLPLFRKQRVAAARCVRLLLASSWQCPCLHLHVD
jgi:hypothetical protein